MIQEKKSASKVYFRPPIVAVLGHVDHGKTTLLDTIRQSNVVASEHGGITQHIGAYQIEYKAEKITFIDTPGHAAFAKMRSYGVSVTDLVILVIAADDGIKPQTKESLAHIKQAAVPFLVAINKIDVPGVSVDQIKGQLAENDVLVEGYGGQIVSVEISAKQKKGIDELLEMILLMGKMQELKADPKGPIEGVIIDSRLDPKRGPVATLIIKNGTLKISDQIYAGEVEARVKLMIDDKGQRVSEAEPGKPVEVLGFKKVPPIGANVHQEKDLFIQRQSQKAIKIPTQNAEDLINTQEENQKVKIILKADTQGTLEAIKSNLPEDVEIISSEVGQVTESDVLLALSTNAEIIAFNVKTPNQVVKLAERELVVIKTYNIIYELLEEIEKRILKILEPTIDEETFGEAEIIAEFRMKGKHIAGCRIKKGKINKKNPIHLQRKGKIIKDARIISLQRERQEIGEAKAGNEIGLVCSPDIDFKIGDVIISYNKSI